MTNAMGLTQFLNNLLITVAMFLLNGLLIVSLYWQLAFEAVRGNGYRGDIALDEIKLTPGKCDEPDTPAPPVVTPTPVKPTTTPKPPTRREGEHAHFKISLRPRIKSETFTL